MRYPSTVLSILISTSLAIPVPNGQLGNVEIECGDKTIEAVFLTEALFEGRIFVIGHAHDPKCVSRDTGRRTTSIVIDKNECGVVTTRSTEPNGLFSTVKLMISFHNDFITKVDRGYEISCFYMAGDSTVTYPITVNTPNLAGITEIAEIPRCRYEVIDPETREPAEVVTVGNKLLHRWVCESTAPDLWCMKVHSCRVEDGSGTEFLILDERGCSIDRYLLDNLEYGPGDLQAQKEAHAFKFADKVIVNFQCSVRLDIKDGECPFQTYLEKLSLCERNTVFHIPDCEDPLRAEQARRANQARLNPSAGIAHTTTRQNIPLTTHRPFTATHQTTHPPQAAHVNAQPHPAVANPPTSHISPRSEQAPPHAPPPPNQGTSQALPSQSLNSPTTTAPHITTQHTTPPPSVEDSRSGRPVFRNPMRPSTVHPQQQRSTPQPPTTRRSTTRNPVHPVFRGPRHAGFASELSLEATTTIEVDVRSQQIDVLDPIFDENQGSARSAEIKRIRRGEDCISRNFFVTAISSSLALITLLIATVVALLLRNPQKV